MTGHDHDGDDRPFAVARSELMNIIAGRRHPKRQVALEALRGLAMSPGVQIAEVSDRRYGRAVVLDGVPIGMMWPPRGAEGWTGWPLLTARLFEDYADPRTLAEDIATEWRTDPVEVFDDVEPRPPHEGTAN